MWPVDRRIFLLFTFLLLVFPQQVMAHEGDPTGGFVNGFTHPILGFDHVLAMVAVGLWGAQLGLPALWLLPVTFPLVMACGGFLGLIGVPIPGIEIGIAVSAITLGAFVSVEFKLQLPVALLLVGIFAIFHGHAHGTELPTGDNGVLYSIGFVIGTGLLHAMGILLGLIHHWKWGRKTIQFAGALIAIGGGYYLWEAVA